MALNISTSEVQSNLPSGLSFLVIQPEVNETAYLQKALKGQNITSISEPNEAIEKIENEIFDCVVYNIKSTDEDTLNKLSILLKHETNPPIVGIINDNTDKNVIQDSGLKYLVTLHCESNVFTDTICAALLGA